MQKFKHIKDSVWISRTGTVTGRYLHFLTPELQYICQSKVHCSSNCLSKKQTKTRRLNPTHIDTPTCLLQILASIIGDFQQFPESAGHGPWASQCRGQDATLQHIHWQSCAPPVLEARHSSNKHPILLQYQ